MGVVASSESGSDFGRRRLRWAADTLTAAGERLMPWRLARLAALTPELQAELALQITVMCDARQGGGRA